MAFFDDNTAAITKNSFWNGSAINIGLSWKNVILRNQINRDFEAQRITSNGFEPTSNVFSLYIKGLFQDYNQHAVRVHTSPSHSSSTLIATHDVDNQTGIDKFNLFVDFEKHNDAPTILLIHPNREFKVDPLSDYYGAIPESIVTMEIGKCGNF